MSLSLYSDEARIAEQLRRGRFRIYYDREDKLIHIESENENEGYPLFKEVYNKKEVDDIIATGGDFNPTTFKKIILMQGLKMIDVQNSPNTNKVETYSEFATHTVENMMALNDRLFKPETFIKTKLIDDGKIVLYSNGEAADADTYERLFNILKQNFENMVPDVKDVKERTSQISVNKDFVSNYDVITEVDGYLKTTKSIVSDNIYPYNHHIFYGVYPPLPSSERNDITEKPVYGKIYQTADLEVFGKCEVDGELKAAVITDHEDRIKAAETSIKNDENTIKSQGERLTTAETTIGSHETRINSAETSIQDHETRIEKLEDGGTGDSYWKINTELVAAKTETIIPVSELWINPNNLIWTCDKDSFYVSDLFLIKYNDVNYTCRYICYKQLHHKTKEIYGIVDAVSYKGLRVHFETHYNHELDWSLADNNTMNIQAMLVVYSSESEQHYDYIDINVNEVLPLYIGNHRYGIGFIVGHAPDALADVDFYINNRIFPLSSVSIAGIDPGDDENEPFQDYTPEEAITTISSIYPVKNNFVMEGPNMLSLTQNYFDRLAINLDETVETKGTDYIRLTFTNITKDILVNSTYTGTLMTYYLPPTKFVNAGGYGIEKICIYRIRTDQNEYQYKTDALILQNGVWTTSLLTVDEVEFCFDLSVSDDYSPRNMYELGLSRIVLEIHNQILTTDKSIVCDEIIANNTFQYQPSTIPNFYAPREIGEEVVGLSKIMQNSYSDYPHESKTLWYIDFGYEPNSDEFNKLGLGQEFRFVDEVAKYEYRAKVVEDDEHNRYWDFDKTGRLCYNMPMESKITNEYIHDGNDYVLRFKWSLENVESLYSAYIDPDEQYINNKLDLTSNDLKNQCGDKLKEIFKAGLATSNISKCTLLYAIDVNRVKSFQNVDLTATYTEFWDNILNSLDSYKHDDNYIYFPNINPGEGVNIPLAQNVHNWFFNHYYVYDHYISYVVQVDLINQFHRDVSSFVFSVMDQSFGSTYYVFNGTMILEKLQSNYKINPILTFKKDSANHVVSTLTFEKNQGLKFYADPDHLEQVSEEVREQWDMKSNLFSFLYKTGRFKIYPLPENTTALYTDKNIISDKIIVGRNIESFLYSLNEVGNQLVDALIDISNLTQAVRNLSNAVETMQQEIVSLAKVVDKIESSNNSVWSWVSFGLSVASAGMATFSILSKLGVFGKLANCFSRCSAASAGYQAIEMSELSNQIWENGENIAPTVLLPHATNSNFPEGYIHVPWYLLNASDEIYELVRRYVEGSETTYEDVEVQRYNMRQVFGDTLPLYEYEYVGLELHDAVYDNKVHSLYNCYCEFRSAIRNIFECGVTDFFNKFEQTPPRSAIIQTPENVEFRVDSITFDNKNITGFADKNNESTWTSDKLVDADFVKSKFNQLETQLNLLIRGMSNISNRLNSLENRLLTLENQS